MSLCVRLERGLSRTGHREEGGDFAQRLHDEPQQDADKRKAEDDACRPAVNETNSN